MKLKDTLPNGATVHAFVEMTSQTVGYHDKGIVLAINDRDEWVTWAYSVHSPASTVWGHYHGDNYKSAIEDFKQRVADLYMGV